MMHMNRAGTLSLSSLLIAGTLYAVPFGERFKAFVLDDGKSPGQSETAFSKVNYGCISCHDGAMGSDVSISSTAERHGDSWASRGRNHPVGMDYDASYMKKRGGLFARPSLPPEIILLDGKVSCLSCHKLKDGMLQSLKVTTTTLKTSAVCTSSDVFTTGAEPETLCQSCHNK